MPKDWDRWKTQLHTYYVVEQLPVTQIEKLMKQQHGFVASIRSYRSRIKDWGYKRQDEKSSTLGNVAVHHRRETSHTSDVIMISNSASDEGHILNATETSSLSDSGRPTRDTCGLSDVLLPSLNPEHSGRGTLRSGPSFVPPRGLTPGDEVNIHALEPTSFAKVPCPCPWLPNWQGLKCLHDAAREGNVPTTTLQATLQNGAALISQDQRGNTPLHIAVGSLQYGMAGSLLHKSNVNLANMDGFTPFHVVLKQARVQRGRYTAMVRRFLTYGANAQLRFPGGETPLGVYLDECMALDDCQLRIEVYGVIQRLLEGHPDSRNWRQSPSEHKFSSLLGVAGWDVPHVAVHLFRIARILCETIDPVTCYRIGLFPLHAVIVKLGACFEFKEFIQILLRSGANPNVRDAAGRTPWQVLMDRDLDNASMLWAAETLLDHGADATQIIYIDEWVHFLESRNVPPKTHRTTIEKLLRASFDRITESGVIHLPPYPRGQSNWVESWARACESIRGWHDVTDHVQEGADSIDRLSLDRLSLDTGEFIFDIALDVLIAKCVEKATDCVNATENRDIEELRLQRNSVTLALGDCQKYNHGIKTDWFYCLLELCEAIAKHERGL